MMQRFVAPVFVTLASATVHTVQVGQSGLSFTPQTISVVNGDTVIFELFPGHNVIEGDFDSPCQTDDDDWTLCSCISFELTSTDMCAYSLQRTIL